MSRKILQVNFKFSVSPDEYDAAVAPMADPIADVPGLQWKAWIMNASEREAGGIYLFSDAASRDGYVTSDIVKGILAHPALSDFSVKMFDVMEAHSAKTHLPAAEAVTA